MSSDGVRYLRVDSIGPGEFNNDYTIVGHTVPDDPAANIDTLVMKVLLADWEWDTNHDPNFDIEADRPVINVNLKPQKNKIKITYYDSYDEFTKLYWLYFI